jgi:competence protein ComEC
MQLLKRLKILSVYKMIFKRLKSLFFYIAERKILLVALSYIFTQTVFHSFSWQGVGVLVIFSLVLIFKFRKILLLILLVIALCSLRNYYDLYIENNVKDYVESNYLNQRVELKGYVSEEPIYKHEFTRVIFKVDSQESFLVQTNTPRFPRLKVGQVCTIGGELIEPESFDEFDYKEFLRNRRIYYIVRYPILNCTEEREGFFLKNNLMDFKKKIRNEVESRLSEPQASLFLGVLFGEKRVFEEDFGEALRVASITHIIVASGYNVSIIFLGINKIFFFVPKRPRTLLTIFLIWVYCVLAGLSPSIIRASIMLSLTLFAVYYGVISNINIVFFASAFIFILIDPRIIKEIGFLLSISATGGLIYITPILDVYIQKFLDFTIPFEKLKNLIYKFLQNYLVPSLACTIITMPIIAYSFQKISIIGVVTNILILPVLEYTLILGFVSLFFNLFSSFISQILFLAIWAQLKYFELIVNFLGNLEYASYDVKITVLIVGVVYILIGILILKFSPVDGKNYYLNLQENL